MRRKQTRSCKLRGPTNQVPWSNYWNTFPRGWRSLIASRLDPRMAARLDVEDVLQEVRLAACRQKEDFLHQPEIPPYVWLRAVAVKKLFELHRYHLGTQKRDARREVSVDRPHGCEASTSAMANHFVDSGTSPSRSAMRAELKSRLETCLDQLPAWDQEVLALRHIEQLDPKETAQVLQLTAKAASMRYLRTLRRLKALFDAQGGNSSALRWTS